MHAGAVLLIVSCVIGWPRDHSPRQVSAVDFVRGNEIVVSGVVQDLNMIMPRLDTIAPGQEGFLAGHREARVVIISVLKGECSYCQAGDTISIVYPSGQLFVQRAPAEPIQVDSAGIPAYGLEMIIEQMQPVGHLVIEDSPVDTVIEDATVLPRPQADTVFEDSTQGYRLAVGDTTFLGLARDGTSLVPGPGGFLWPADKASSLWKALSANGPSN